MSNITSDQIRALTEKLNRYRHEYYNLNTPSVSDEVYDKLFDELVMLESESGYRMSNSPTLTVGYTAVSRLEKTRHTIPLLSLDKTKSADDLLKFAGGERIMLMLKLDGLTVKLKYEDGRFIQASTRGDGNEGEIITHNMRAVSGIPSEIPYNGRLVVAGEAYILNSDFEELKDTLVDSSGEPYRNSRNLAAGSVRCLDSAVCAERRIRFTPFSVLEGLDDIQLITPDSKNSKLIYLKELGFQSCERYFLQQATKNMIEMIIEILKKKAKTDGIPIDGIVATYDSISYSRNCGRTGHHYKDGLAFKFEDGLYGTVLQYIEWTPSRTGEIAPVAVFKTVTIDGCEVSRASLHNLTFIKVLELMPGCRILVSKRNMIIPHVEENLDCGKFDAAIAVPPCCPCCGGEVTIRTSSIDKLRPVETVHCENDGCTVRHIKRFEHFASKKAMDIEGFSQSAIAKFIRRGWLRSFSDIYKLDRYKAEIIELGGFGEKSYAKLWDAIQNSRNTTFERCVVAMDIPMVGSTASKELSRVFEGDLDAFSDAVYMGYNFTQLHDFGETLHSNIHEWFQKSENISLWRELKSIVSIKKEESAAPAIKENPFAGKTVVVTGTLEHFTRSSINAKIESLGAKAGDSVSKNTHYLICGEKAGSKLSKAQSLGVTVLTEQQFLEMTGE